jgi:hypothetical protein
MCDECDESSGLYLAYFNKPGGNRWRPPPKAAVAPLAVDRRAVKPVPVAVREVRRYNCDQGSMPALTPGGTSQSSHKVL